MVAPEGSGMVLGLLLPVKPVVGNELRATAPAGRGIPPESAKRLSLPPSPEVCSPLPSVELAPKIDM
jgi:hypothetical protein